MDTRSSLEQSEKVQKIKAFGTFDVYGSLYGFMAIDLAKVDGELYATLLYVFCTLLKKEKSKSVKCSLWSDSPWLFYSISVLF